MLLLKIAEPCHEKWGDMSPGEKGMFCHSCKKVVTDFSTWSDEEVFAHLRDNGFQASCGRFRKDQLNRPLLGIDPAVLHMDIPIWKKFIAALFICFSGLLISCGTKTGTEVNASAAIVPAYPANIFFTTASSSGDRADTKKELVKSEGKLIFSESFIPQDCNMVFGGFGMEYVDLSPKSPLLTMHPDK